ncbi:hypothetical protein D1007_56835 [Hordeum vulgare]|nr:hypothetical protein D1007_56835 [Hordeum vulgare]
MAAASDAFSSTNYDSQGKEDDLGDFFDKLDLHEEFDDVVVEEEAPELLEDIRWVALARVHTLKSFSQTTFYKDMRAAWNCSQQVHFRPIGPNLFVVQVYCLGDWDRIMQEGPWLFRNMDVQLAPYDGFTKAEEVPVVYMPICMQIHKLPDEYCRHALIVKLLRGAREVLETRINGNSRGDYVRVRVKHDIRKLLTKFIGIVKDKTRKVFVVRYEKLARFCSACSIIGHEHKEYGNDMFEEKDLKFGAYLYADHLVRGRSDWEDQTMKNANINPSVSSPVVIKEVQVAKGEQNKRLNVNEGIDLDLDKSSCKRLNVNEGIDIPAADGSFTPRGKVLLITDGQGADVQDEPSNTVGSKRAKSAIPVEPQTEPATLLSTKPAFSWSNEEESKTADCVEKVKPTSSISSKKDKMQLSAMPCLKCHEVKATMNMPEYIVGLFLQLVVENR